MLVLLASKLENRLTDVLCADCGKSIGLLSNNELQAMAALPSPSQQKGLKCFDCEDQSCDICGMRVGQYDLCWQESTAVCKLCRDSVDGLLLELWKTIQRDAPNVPIESLVDVLGHNETLTKDIGIFLTNYASPGLSIVTYLNRLAFANPSQTYVPIDPLRTFWDTGEGWTTRLKKSLKRGKNSANPVNF